MNTSVDMWLRKLLNNDHMDQTGMVFQEMLMALPPYLGT